MEWDVNVQKRSAKVDFSMRFFLLIVVKQWATILLFILIQIMLISTKLQKDDIYKKP